MSRLRKKKRLPKPRAGRRSKKRSWAWALTAITIVGFGISLLSLFPRISVGNYQPIDPDDTFSTPFHITNDGYMPLFFVRFYMGLATIKQTNNIQFAGSTYYGPRFGSGKVDATAFWPTDAYDFTSASSSKHRNSWTRLILQSLSATTRSLFQYHARESSGLSHKKALTIDATGFSDLISGLPSPHKLAAFAHHLRHSVQQFRPVPLPFVREMWRARPMAIAIHNLTKQNRDVRFTKVRSEGKVLMSLLRGWQLLPR